MTEVKTTPQELTVEQLGQVAGGLATFIEAPAVTPAGFILSEDGFILREDGFILSE
jgi:hypothetical protein